MEATVTGTSQEFTFTGLHLQPNLQPSDPIFDPRWENIYIPTDTATNFDWMHYRHPEDDISSASSSSDGSYAHSVYSASSDHLNPLNYTLPSSTYQPYSNDPFAQNPHPTSTLPPTMRQHTDDANAWVYSHQQPPHPQNNTAAHNSYHPNPAGGDPYHHQQQRDSGDYSSGGEDQQPTHFSLSPSPHHHPQSSQPQPQQIYMPFHDLASGGGSGGGPGPGANSGASPYAGHTKASELYASPSPAGTAYTNPATSDGQIPPGSSGGAYPSSYASPNSQGVAAGPGGSRLTPVLETLSIEQGFVYSPSPLSPAGQGSQHQQLPPVSGNGGATSAYGPSPGPSRNNTRMIPTSQSTSGTGTSPYGRPRPAHHSGSHGHHHSHHHRYAGHQHDPSNGSSALSSTSSQQSQPSQQQHQHTTSAFSPSGMADGRKIFTNNSAILPPIGNSKLKKEMVGGTPTHPDIPRPAVIAPPVPVPNLTKKSRGRQVPSVNSMSNAGNSVTSSHSSSRERRHDGGAGRERSYDGGLESPLSPHATSGGYFPSAQWSDSEYEDANAPAVGRRSGGAGPVPHGHHSLFGQPPVPMDSYGNHIKSGGPGSTSTTSSPATSLSSRPTMEDAGPSNSTAAAGGPGTLAAGSLEAELRSRPFVCSVEGCGKAYIRAEHLKRHVRSIHTNDKPYECPHPGCGREFSRYDNLCQHFKGVHGSTSTSRIQQQQR